ncbi:hypothetical protein [Bacillus salipaludis]|uniref:Uncharacterized protein n=1 Tax=Bacillus salipaludis TaxID=2547811 RepID=A0AA90Z5S9_9BACI|nr:hypothetical protein [Bacillus salipaludis]MDQ6600744.1 hypothetical protein [Bacillus salipaludis]
MFVYNDTEEMTDMAIRDRGMKKWQFAFGHPELIKGQRDLGRDQERIAKPIVDAYELEEFDSRIAYAMEINLAVVGRIYFGYKRACTLRGSFNTSDTD